MGARARASRNEVSNSAWSAGRGVTFAIDDEAGGIEPVLEAVAEADEGIARQALATFHAFQQEARAEWLELQVRRDWRIEISGNVEQGRRHSRLLWREDPGRRTTKNPSHGGSRRWVLDSSERNYASGPTPL